MTALAFVGGLILGAIGAMIWGGVIVTRSARELIGKADDVYALAKDTTEDAHDLINAARRLRGLGPQAPVVRLRDVGRE
jgi:hypothetical protein